MWDFPGNAAALAATARAVYERGGAIAAVCHGPSALVDLTLSDELLPRRRQDRRRLHRRRARRPSA